MDGHVIQLIKKYRHLPGPFKCYPLCANKREKYCKCPWDSSSHFFLMISTESCISPPRTVKTAPSFPGTCESCWSAGLTPFPPLHRSLSAGTAAEHLGTARNGNKLRRKGQGQSGEEGPRSERRGPAPRTQLWALCFCFPSPLCCQKVPWRAAGPEVSRRQSGSCKADSFSRWVLSRWVQREGKEMHV